MRTQYITFAANEVKTFESAGGYFEILSAANDLASIDWITEDGGFSDPWELVKEGVFGYLPFKGFRITNGPTAQTIKVLFGQGSGGNRAAPVSGSVGILGVVDVEDQGERSAKLGRTYVGHLATSYVLPVDQYAQLIISNPIGSGVVASVRRTVIDFISAMTGADWGAEKFYNYSATPGGVTQTPAGAGSSVAGRLSKCLFLVRASSVLPPESGFTGFAAKKALVKGASTLGQRDHELIALAEGEAFVLWVKNGPSTGLELAMSMGWIENGAGIDQ